MNHYDAMREILEEHGIIATPEQIEKATDDFEHHLQCYADMMGEKYSSPSPKQCSTCNSLRSELSEANKTIEVYKNSVKQRRNADDVWTEGDRVMYR